MFTDVFRSFSVVLFVGLSLAPSLLWAQDQDTTDQQLPEIAPQEIEIRGELQVSFPTLQRQPLEGFSSPPTIPSVPDGRTPYAASYKQELENLPESLPTPETASESVSTPKSPKHGFVQLGGGRYASRFAEARYSLDLTPQQSLSFHGDYFGTEGFSPFPSTAPDVNTPWDTFDGHARFTSRHDGLSFSAAVNGRAERYTLYGLSPQGGQVPERSGLSVGPEAQLQTFGAFESTFQVKYNHTTYSTGSSSPTFIENRLDLDGTASFALGAAPVRLDAALGRSTYSGDVPNSSGFTAEGGAEVAIANSEQFSVRVGGRALGYESPLDPQSAPSSTVSDVYIVPQGRAELSFAPGLSLYAENRPQLSGESLVDLYTENPFAESVPVLRPTLYTTKAETGALLSLGAVRLQPVVGFDYAPSYRAFSSPTGVVSAPFEPSYESARIVRGGGQIALQGVEGLEASIEAFVRDGQLVGPSRSIPYFSPMVARAMFSVSFADQRGLFQTTGTIESPRPIDESNSAQVGTYVAFDVEGSYEVTPLLDVVLQIRNLSPSAPTRWAQYARPPTMAMAGFRIHW
jgi:hypothetical protein